MWSNEKREYFTLERCILVLENVKIICTAIKILRGVMKERELTLQKQISKLVNGAINKREYFIL